ncbi:hypothetical protein HanRHA438_Chr03g0101621 [Helianthus annuus]|nr:hypothetical protein HanRHA438_Chr03g0101621 [Helianthus annuus]
MRKLYDLRKKRINGMYQFHQKECCNANLQSTKKNLLALQCLVGSFQVPECSLNH